MDEIPFEKVSVEDAKRVMQAGAVKNEAHSAPANKWERNRSMPGQPLSSSDLSPIAFKWLAALPREVRPNSLARQFPRIANRLAEIWKRPLQCERYIDDLMIDLRGGRQGFPPAVAAEIAALKVHFLRTTNTVHFGVWGNRIGVD
ncbi:MAG TPA: hypothetical protein VEC35_07070 [Noviherbaspirillum sp.]|nr:hypothetical protein [Noviherbaspirillum sp.]